MDLQLDNALIETIDRCNLAFFDNQSLTALERYELVRGIAANLESATAALGGEDLFLFTGERLRTRAAASGTRSAT